MQPPFDLNLMANKHRNERDLINQADAAHLIEKSKAITRAKWPRQRAFFVAWNSLVKRQLAGWFV